MQESKYSIFDTPKVKYDVNLEKSKNVFFDAFGNLNIDSWEDKILKSIENNYLDGIYFPSFPDVEFQARIHGHYGAHSIKEAFNFYKFISTHRLTSALNGSDNSKYFLDFGSGWGRITRPFLRDFPLKNMFAFEPDLTFCSVARSLNPYVSFVSGDYMPNKIFDSNKFNLIVGWSIFSHLSEMSATAWLAEFSRILAPGGAAVMTTWGDRFLNRLENEQKLLDEGKDVHWYSKVCLSASGNIRDRVKDYNDHKFVWFTNGGSKLYGEAFFGREKLEDIINKNNLNLTVEVFDKAKLAQDVFVVRKN